MGRACMIARVRGDYFTILLAVFTAVAPAPLVV